MIVRDGKHPEEISFNEGEEILINLKNDRASVQTQLPPPHHR